MRKINFKKILKMRKINFCKGSYLIIDIVGRTDTFIAEVTQESPLRLKVEEDGPFAHLKAGDFIIHENESLELQKDYHKFLKEAKKKNQFIVSGLKSIGVKSG